MRNDTFPNQSPYHILFCNARFDATKPSDLQTATDLNFYAVDEVVIEGYDAERLLQSLPLRNADMVHVYRDSGDALPLFRSESGLVVAGIAPILGVDTLVPNGRFVSKELGSDDAHLSLLEKMKVGKGILTAKNVVVPIGENDGDHGIVVFDERGGTVLRYQDAVNAANTQSLKMA